MFHLPLLQISLDLIAEAGTSSLINSDLFVNKMQAVDRDKGKKGKKGKKSGKKGKKKKKSGKKGKKGKKEKDLTPDR